MSDWTCRTFSTVFLMSFGVAFVSNIIEDILYGSGEACQYLGNCLYLCRFDGLAMGIIFSLFTIPFYYEWRINKLKETKRDK